MSGESPNVIIYDVSGQEMSVSNGLAIPTATSALLFAGSDGTNAHYILMDGSGRTIVAGAGTAGTPTGGVLTIQGISGGTVVPVSGTVTANQGTANSLANAWTTELTDGTHGPVAVKAASTAAVATDPSLVVSISPNNTVTVVGDAASGSALAGNPVLVAGSDGTDARNLSTNTSGNLLVAQAAVTGVALADAWTTKITDATNGPVAVKPASTAAVATDPALVVAISPNNALSLSAADITNTGALGALNATVSVTHPGLGSVGFQLAAGTLIGTIIPEVSFDGGTTWNATFFDIPNTGNIVTSFVFGSSNTATAATIAGVGGAGQTRVRVSAYTSGTANITVRASDISDPSLLNSGAAGAALPPIVGQVGGSVTTSSPTYTTGTLNALSLTTAGAIRIDGSAVTQPVSLSGTVTVVGDAASGSAVAGNPVLIAGSDGTDARTISTDASGHAIVLGAQTAETTAAWTSATSVNATAALTVTGYGTIAVTLNQGTTITGGVLTFEVSDTVAGTNWYPIGVISSYSSIPTSTYTLVASTNIAFQMNISAFIQFRVRLSTVISGTGTVNVGIAANYTSAPIENQQFTLITDGTHGPVAVKAASTAAVATDPALVVAVSPNNIVSSLSGDVTTTGTLGALNAAVQVVTAGLNTAGFQLAAGTLIGTILPEVSFDGGTTWNSTYFDTPTSGKVSTIVFASANTATAATIVGVGGSGLSRVRVSAYTSGTANVTVRATTRTDPSVLFATQAGLVLPPTVAVIAGSDGTDARAITTDTSGRLMVIGAAAAGAAVAGNPVLIAGSDGTDARTLLTNASGNLLIGQASADVTSTGALGALNATVSVTHPGLTAVGMQLIAGTLIGTIIPEVSFDGGTTWNSTFFHNPGTGVIVSSIVFGSANTANAESIVGVGGAGMTRIRVSAYTSGTANITVRASDITTNVSLLSQAATGSAVPPVTQQIGGSDGTDIRTLSTDTSGKLKTDIFGNAGAIMDAVITAATAPANGIAHLNVYQTTVPALTAGQSVASQSDTTGALWVNKDSRRATFRATAVGITPVAASSFPIMTLIGSSTKTVRVTHINIQVTSTTGLAAPSLVTVQRLSSLTGGTAVGHTAVLMDTGNAAASAVMDTYTTVPTASTVVANIASGWIQYMTAALTYNSVGNLDFYFGDDGGQQFILRGTSQWLSLLVATIGASAPLMCITVEWIEDNS